MSAVSKRLDVGGTPAWNAAMALIMLAESASDPHPVSSIPADLRDPFMTAMIGSASGIVDAAITAAEARGFDLAAEFRALIAAGAMTEELRRLAADVVHLSGGPGKFFELVGLAVAPAGAGGAS